MRTTSVKYKSRRFKALMLTLSAALTLSACGQATSGETTAAGTVNSSLAADTGTTQAETATADSAATASDAEITTITFAYRVDAYPTSYQDDSGSDTGYDIEMLKLIDEALPDYQFKYVPTSYDDVYVGLEAGSYDAGITNAFWTETRAEKYLIPEQAIGASVLVLGVRTENQDITNLAELAASGLELAPILAGNGMYYVVSQYKEDNPEAQVELTTTDNASFVAGSIEELAAGKYDAVIYTKNSWETNFVAEDGSDHVFADQVVGHEFDLALTYPMFSQSVGEDFVTLFSDTTAALVASGQASELSQTFFGYDIWNYEY